MLRLFTNHSVHELWRCSHFVASCVTNRQIGSFLPVSSAAHHRLHIPARRFTAGIPVLTDALQPKGEKSEEIQTLDLDKWKSIMRAQAAPEEKQEVSDEEEAIDGEGDDLKDSNSLEAIRELVVMWRQAGKLVPQVMTDEEVQTLAELTTKSSRKKYLKYLAIKEGHKLSRKEKQQQRKVEREERRGQDGNDEEPELQNRMHIQFWNRSLDKHLAWKSAQAMLFGQPLVYDMSYEASMSTKELENTVTQLMLVEGLNRRATDPYHLHFCNLQATGAYQKTLLKRYGEESWNRLLITTTNRQHVDVFPREQLVYLTADSPNVLRKYDHSKVYIVGALVDGSIHSGLSLANAKRLNLATARLPLDEYLHWELGAKNLTLDQMICIMLCLKETGKWEEALKFVPTRKYDGFHQRETSSSRFPNHGPRQGGDRPLRSGERHVERTFKSEGLDRTQKESGFGGRDRMAGLPGDRGNKQAGTRVRTSFRSNVEGRKGAGKGKMWWEELSQQKMSRTDGD